MVLPERVLPPILPETQPRDRRHEASPLKAPHSKKPALRLAKRSFQNSLSSRNQRSAARSPLHSETSVQRRSAAKSAVRGRKRRLLIIGGALEGAASTTSIYRIRIRPAQQGETPPRPQKKPGTMIDKRKKLPETAVSAALPKGAYDWVCCRWRRALSYASGGGTWLRAANGGERSRPTEAQATQRRATQDAAAQRRVAKDGASIISFS